MSKGKFEISAIFKAIDNMTRPMRGMTMNVNRFAKSLEKSLEGPSRMFGMMDQKLRAVGKAAVIGGAVTAAGLTLAGKAGADFEEAISGVGAVSLSTRDQIMDLEKEALRLGSTTKFTATEAANAMEVMARAGFSNQEILAGVGGVLHAAAAEGAEMAEVANHVSNVLKGMGLEAKEAGRVSDVLALASARTNSSISTLGESMKNLSPVAKQMGIGLEDAVGMVALLQDVGLDASEAGTATATMLTKLSKPSDEVARKMKQMGIAFKDAKGNMLPPLEIFSNMQKAAGKLGGNMDQVAFFADLVGLRGQKAALNLKDLFASDKGQKLTEALRNATGSAEKMASLRMDNLKGDMTILSSTVEGLQVALFQTESGPLRGMVQGITAWTNANQGLIVSGFVQFMDNMRRDLPSIVMWTKRIAAGVAVFYALRLAIVATTIATEAYSIAVGATTLAEGKSLTAMVLGTGARWARNVATWAVTASSWAYFAAYSATLKASAALNAIEIRGTVARWARNAANWATSASTWAYNAAVGASEVLTTRITVAEVAGTVARWARNAANWATTTSTAAYNTVIGAGSALIAAVTVREWALSGAQWARNAATWAGTASTSAYGAALAFTTGAVGTVTAALWASVPAAWAAIAPFMPLIGAAAAATAGVTALYYALVNLKSIWDMLGGLDGVTATIGKMWDMGTLDVAAANDAVMNDQARARAATPQAANPNETIRREITENRSKGEVTVVSDKPARVTKPAPGLRVRAPVPSGAF